MTQTHDTSGKALKRDTSQVAGCQNKTMWMQTAAAVIGGLVCYALSPVHARLHSSVCQASPATQLLDLPFPVPSFQNPLRRLSSELRAYFDGHSTSCQANKAVRVHVMMNP